MDDKSETSAAREAFEVWGKTRGLYVSRRDGEYPDSAARFAWEAWLASWMRATKRNEHAT